MRMFSSQFLVLVVLLALGLPAPVAAQPAGATAPAPAPQTVEEPSDSSVASDSPRAALRAFLEAADTGRWGDAGRYLLLPEDLQARRQELAERLKGIIDSRGVVDLETLSPDSSGNLDDGLPPELELVAMVPTAAGNQAMRLTRTSDADGPFWAFSTTTASRIDTWYEALPDRWVRDVFTSRRMDFMLRPGPWQVLWWQWLAFPIVGLMSWGVGRIFRAGFKLVLGFLTARTQNTWDDRLMESIGPPLTLAFAILVFKIGTTLMQLTPAAVDHVGPLLRAALAFAFFWGLWRSSQIFMAYTQSRPWAATSPSARNLLSVSSNILRGVIVGIGAIGIIAALGYPVGTVLAGLGIGGLALAFGAQKTVENVFGSVSLAVDQPFRIGDFVKVDDFVGTVEDIGIRSTRFRTLDRTVVSIPNGKLADQRLESFQARDRMRLATTVGLTYDTTREQMQTVLTGLEDALRAHPRIWTDAVVVKFKEFGASSLDIEIMAWFDVPTWADFQLCRQEVLLEFMRVVEGAGASFAFPTRTVHLIHDGPAPGPTS